jgi:hypothetical protein
MKKGTNSALLLEQIVVPGDKIDDLNLIAVVLVVALNEYQLYLQLFKVQN